MNGKLKIKLKATFRGSKKPPSSQNQETFQEPDKAATASSIMTPSTSADARGSDQRGPSPPRSASQPKHKGSKPRSNLGTIPEDEPRPSLAQPLSCDSSSSRVRCQESQTSLCLIGDGFTGADERMFFVQNETHRIFPPTFSRYCQASCQDDSQQSGVAVIDGSPIVHNIVETNRASSHAKECDTDDGSISLKESIDNTGVSVLFVPSSTSENGRMGLTTKPVIDSKRMSSGITQSQQLPDSMSANTTVLPISNQDQAHKYFEISPSTKDSIGQVIKNVDTSHQESDFVSAPTTIDQGRNERNEYSESFFAEIMKRCGNESSKELIEHGGRGLSELSESNVRKDDPILEAGGSKTEQCLGGKECSQSSSSKVETYIVFDSSGPHVAQHLSDEWEKSFDHTSQANTGSCEQSEACSGKDVPYASEHVDTSLAKLGTYTCEPSDDSLSKVMDPLGSDSSHVTYSAASGSTVSVGQVETTFVVPTEKSSLGLKEGSVYIHPDSRLGWPSMNPLLPGTPSDSEVAIVTENIQETTKGGTISDIKSEGDEDAQYCASANKEVETNQKEPLKNDSFSQTSLVDEGDSLKVLLGDSDYQQALFSLDDRCLTQEDNNGLYENYNTTKHDFENDHSLQGFTEEACHEQYPLSETELCHEETCSKVIADDNVGEETASLKNESQGFDPTYPTEQRPAKGDHGSQRAEKIDGAVGLDVDDEAAKVGCGAAFSLQEFPAGLVDVYELEAVVKETKDTLNRTMKKYRHGQKRLSRLLSHLEQLRRESEEMARLVAFNDRQCQALQLETHQVKVALAAVSDKAVETIRCETQAHRLEPTCYRKYLNVRSTMDATSVLTAIRNRQKALYELEILVFRKQLVLQHVLPKLPQEDKALPLRKIALPMPRKMKKSNDLLKASETTVESSSSGAMSPIVLEVIAAATPNIREISTPSGTSGADSQSSLTTPALTQSDDVSISMDGDLV